jgi:hypothetical protein
VEHVYSTPLKKNSPVDGVAPKCWADSQVIKLNIKGTPADHVRKGSSRETAFFRHQFTLAYILFDNGEFFLTESEGCKSAPMTYEYFPF